MSTDTTTHRALTKHEFDDGCGCTFRGVPLCEDAANTCTPMVIAARSPLPGRWTRLTGRCRAIGSRYQRSIADLTRFATSGPRRSSLPMTPMVRSRLLTKHQP